MYTEELRATVFRLKQTLQYENEIIPFINLRDIFNNKTDYPEKAKLVVVNNNSFQFALVTDEIIGEHQAVVKPLGNILKKQDYFTGVSLLGDGNLAFMIDLAHMQEYMLSRMYTKVV